MVDMVNLLEETVKAIDHSGHETTDILYVGNRDASLSIDWSKVKHVLDVDYDHDFGGQEIADDLVVRFKDGGFLWRNEYDGSEWWEYTAPFRPAKHSREFKFVKFGGKSYWHDQLLAINYPNDYKEAI